MAKLNFWEKTAHAFQQSLDFTDRLNTAIGLVTALSTFGLGAIMSNVWVALIIPALWFARFLYLFLKGPEASKPSIDQIIVATRFDTYQKELAHIIRGDWPAFDRKIAEILKPVGAFYDDFPMLEAYVNDLEFASRLLFVICNVQSTNYRADELDSFRHDVSLHMKSVCENIRSIMLIKKTSTSTQFQTAQDIIDKWKVCNMTYPWIGTPEGITLLKFDAALSLSNTATEKQP